MSRWELQIVLTGRSTSLDLLDRSECGGMAGDAGDKVQERGLFLLSGSMSMPEIKIVAAMIEVMVQGRLKSRDCTELDQRSAGPHSRGCIQSRLKQIIPGNLTVKSSCPGLSRM